MLNKEWVLMKVLLHLADGFEEIEALSTLDILRRADIDTTTVSIMGRIEVKSSRGMLVQADQVIENINYEDYDMIKKYRCEKDEYGTPFNEEDCIKRQNKLRENIKEHEEFEQNILTKLQNLSEIMRIYGKIEWNRAKEGK